MADITNLDYVRARRRVNQFNDTIDRFVRILTEANGSAVAAENAKLAYLATLPVDIRADLGYE